MRGRLGGGRLTDRSGLAASSPASATAQLNIRLTATTAPRRAPFHPGCASSHRVKARGGKVDAGAAPKRSTKGTTKWQ
jgi:hypothetical protein